ncbi:MAG: response regulator transcription factor [Muribaculaceae bacterium]|nr:response regulator transcription factor [Muribaculaceae bacterium]
MKRLSTIVVEDERLPRLALLKKLEELSDSVEVIAAVDNYDDALQTIARLRPDLVLLDIQLRGRDTIAMLDELKAGDIPLPLIIFTTAYADRRYLMGAIKVNAVDYLMKPINRNDLAVAIAKAVERAGLVEAEPMPGKLSLRTVSGRLFLEPDDIAAIRADGNYSRFITFNGEEAVLESLAALERRLDPAAFVRADRSTIVNATLIYRINAKRQQCTLRAPAGTLLTIDLSKTAVEALLHL